MRVGARARRQRDRRRRHPVRFDTGGDPVLLPLSAGESFRSAHRRVARHAEGLRAARACAASDGVTLLEGEPGTASAPPRRRLRRARRPARSSPRSPRCLPASRRAGGRPRRARGGHHSRDLRVEVNAGVFHPSFTAAYPRRVYFFRRCANARTTSNFDGMVLTAFGAGAHDVRLHTPEQTGRARAAQLPANVRDLVCLWRGVPFRAPDEQRRSGRRDPGGRARAVDRESIRHLARLLQSASPLRNLR